MMDNIIIWACSDMDYEGIKNNIIVRVVPAVVLPASTCVFEIIGDLAIVPVYVPSFDDLDNVYFIPESVFSKWNVRRNIFFNYCIQNTEKHYSLEIRKTPISGSVGVDSLNLNSYDIPMITVKEFFKYGAAAILYKDVCKKISEKWNDSFYIVFVSSDCAVLHKFGTKSVNDMIRHLKSTNELFAKDDLFLTNHIYYYDKSKEHIFMYKSEDYKRLESFIKDINNNDCENYLDLCAYYQVSEKSLDYALNYIESGKLANDNCYTVLVEKLIEFEKEVQT